MCKAKAQKVPDLEKAKVPVQAKKLVVLARREQFMAHGVRRASHERHNHEMAVYDAEADVAEARLNLMKAQYHVECVKKDLETSEIAAAAAVALHAAAADTLASASAGEAQWDHLQGFKNHPGLLNVTVEFSYSDQRPDCTVKVIASLYNRVEELRGMVADELLLTSAAVNLEYSSLQGSQGTVGYDTMTDDQLLHKYVWQGKKHEFGRTMLKLKGTQRETNRRMY